MYIKRKGAGMMGLSGAENCDSTQQWDANCKFNGLQGQCVPAGMVGKQPGCDYSSSGGGFSSFLSSLVSGATDVLKAKVATPTTTNITQVSPGMSTEMKVALAGAGVLALVLILKR